MHSQVLALYGQGRLAEALPAAWHTVTAYPNSARAQYTYASLLRDAGRFREALAVIDQTVRAGPSADALVLRGDLQRTLTGAHAAETDYLQALRLQPGHAMAVHNLAVSRMRMGTVTAAVRGLLEAARLDPGLRALAEDNMALAVTRVLRWATAAVVLLAAALIVVGAMHADGAPTVLPRIAAAVFTGVPIVAIGWTLRTVPGPTLRVVLRRHPVLGLRLLFLVLAVIAGLAGVAGATAGAGVTGPLLVLGVIVLTLLGWMTGA
jgi:hypothetical protein